jgi:16S rRNA (guanine966-N2)-methyltransferase
VRISGGSAKGRKIGPKKAFLKKGEGDELRPTSAKVREALFDIIRKELPGSAFLDLYAGTGGVGIEALSRGAAKAVMVETNTLRARLIEHLLSEFGFSGRARVANVRACDFMEKDRGKGQRYDIIFLDPPYGSGEITKIISLIGEGKIIREGGLVIAEHFSKTKLPEAAGSLSCVKSYKYGDTVLTLYKSRYDL